MKTAMTRILSCTAALALVGCGESQKTDEQAAADAVDEMRTHSAQAVDATQEAMQSAKKAFVAEFQTQLADADARINALRNQAREAGGDVGAELSRRITALEEQQDALNESLGEVADASGDAWRETADGAEDAWSELQKGLEQAEASM